MSDPENIDDLLASSALPEDFDPLADGILMKHQREWLEDPADLKLAEKGRRTGITFAEALDDTIIAASARSAGGDNIFYIGDTKEKGLEFIRYVGHFARVVAKDLAEIEEFLFEDKQEDGDSKYISAYRVRFRSGFNVVALSSRPANIRGLQGIVVIDEAAFHQNVAAVLDAVNALLIWGGKIRIISSHNGEDNPFNNVIKDTRKGQYNYSIHHIPFSLAVKNGLHERVCLMRGWTPSEEGKQAWLDKIIKSYGPRAEARDEELEAIPRKSSGAYFPRSLIQLAQDDGVPTVTWSQPEAWYLDKERMAQAKIWVREILAPLLGLLDPKKRTVFGQDFGRDGDLSVITVSQEERPAQWRAAFMLELRRIPFDVQKYVLFELIKGLPRFLRGSLDARGNGQSHAEAAQQEFGINRIDCIKATLQWYAEFFPEYRAALEDRSFTLCDGEDVVTDHRLAVLVKGNPTVGDTKNKGVDGEWRHGDSMIAWLLGFVASRMPAGEYDYEPAGPRQVQSQTGWRDHAEDGDDDHQRGMGIMPELRGTAIWQRP
jgi:phage FluMu gp28-like protein